MLRIGCHLSSSKGFFHMGKEAVKIGANTFQFFTRNPRGSRAKEIDPEDVRKFLEYAQEHDICQILAHAPYTLNPCSKDAKTREFAWMTMEDDLKRMEHVPGNCYNFHPGSHVGQGAQEGIRMISEMLNQILKEEQHTTVLLETMAGKGTEVGRSFEELAQILDRVELKSHMGVCLDTCHVYDAGYDLVGQLDQVLEEFDRVIGLERLKAIHMNDSKNPFASHKDRHEKIGEGAIGLEAFERMVNHPKLQGIPIYLETQKSDLETQKASLESQQADLQSQQADLQAQMDEKKATSSDYEAQIATAQQQANEISNLISQQQAQLDQIAEEKRQAEEEAARQAAAEEAARQQAAAEEASRQQAAASSTSTSSGNSSASQSSRNNSTTNNSNAATGSSSDKSSSTGSSGSVNSSGASGSTIVAYADQFVGNPYVWGGNSLTNGIDCSHFVYQVLKNTGAYSGGYTTSAGWRSLGTAVSSLSEAKAGDVICYSGHVAIYDGNGGIVEAKGTKWGITHDRSANCKTILAIRRFT